MKLKAENLIHKLHALATELQRHATFICIVIFAVLYGYILFTVSSLSQKAPGETAVNEQLKTVSRPKINKDAARAMERLEDRNVKVQAIFEQARDNPFTE